jgi:opacity protein-like surface antigen
MVFIMKCSRVAFLCFVFAVIGASAAQAQIDVSGSYFESFNGSSSGVGTKQSTPNNSGGMGEVRYLRSALVGGAMNVSYNKTSITFSPNGTQCYYTCQNPVTTVKGSATEISFDWIPSIKVGKIRAFGIGGTGFYIVAPGNSVEEVQTVVRPVFVAGGGVDFAMSAHLGLRLQYRDNIYKAANPFPLYPATGAYTMSSEPMGGVYYRF